MPAKHQDALLQEYQLCSEQVTRMDNLIWQTAAIIFPITLAGFAFFGSSTSHTVEQFLVIVVTGFGSIALLTTWYLLARRWYVYQSVSFYRMREIEEELGLWHYRYTFFVRKSLGKRQAALGQIEDEERKRFERLDEHTGSMPIIGLSMTTTLITIVFIIGWIILIIREAVLSF